MTADADEEIALRVQEGSKEAFGELVDRYGDKLSRYARKFLFGGDDIEDLVQEVFIKAYSNIQSFDVSRKFSSWIYRIAHNEFINAGKKRQRANVFSFDLDVILPQFTAKETADSEAERREMREMLDSSLAALDEKYREPLVLYFFEDLDYKDIADVLHVPISTVGVRLARGKSILRRLVSEKHRHNL